ncbi:hypothetical protein AAVH_13188 [Aphelenchoides avenae]|nr:hypothetical protein AAVH_13188 [Aphelenchus avenae]
MDSSKVFTAIVLLCVLSVLAVNGSRFKRTQLEREKRDSPGCGPYNPRACGAETAMAYGYTGFGQGGGYGGGYGGGMGGFGSPFGTGGGFPMYG